MKKILLLCAILATAILCFASCKPNTPDTPDTPDVPDAHIHSFGEWEIRKPATCTTEGERARYCPCGEKQTEVIYATGVHAEIIDAEIPATCTENGLTEGKHCSTCGDVLVKQEIIPALGHNLVNYKCENCDYQFRSEGLEFTSNDDGTCYVSGIGTCTDSEIVIPETSPNGDLVTVIGPSALKNCSQITNVVIPDSVTIIGNWAFHNCSNLTSLVIPNNVTTIEYCAFYSCNNLTSVIIGDGVISIGDSAFCDCGNLTSIVIGNNVKTIDVKAFAWCSNLTSITVDPANEYYKSINDNLYTADGKILIQYAIGKTDSEFVIPDGVTTIGDSSFSTCSNLTSVVIPDSVTTIGGGAFSWCYNLMSLEISNNVTIIGNDAFRSCSSLKTVVIGNNVTTIGYYAFHDCAGLTSVIIGDSVTTIDSHTFSLCTSLKSVTIPASVTTIGYYVFDGCDNLQNVYYIGDEEEWVEIVIDPTNESYLEKCTIYFVKYSEGLEFISNGNGTCYVSGIGTCSDTDIVIPPNSPEGDRVIAIGEKAFSQCYSLRSVIISASVTTIGDSAFSWCLTLTSVLIPDSVTTIGDHAFYDCRNLTSVVVPYSVTYISGAFKGCDNLTSITVDLANEYYQSIDGDLYTKDGKTLIQYAIGKTNNECVILDDVTTIGDSAFAYCKNITSVVIHDSVTTIGCSAFYICSNLESVVIGDTVTFIGDYAFYDCFNLTDVYYTGSEEQWAEISVGGSNDYLLNATIHYNYVPEE